MTRPLASLFVVALLVGTIGCSEDDKPSTDGSSGASGADTAAAASPDAAAASPDAAAASPDAAAASPDAAAAAGAAPETAAALGLASGPSGAAAAAGAAPATPIAPPNPEMAKKLLEGNFVTSASGIRMRELAAGSGAKLEKGMTANFAYVTYLENGAKIDDSAKIGAPITMPGIGNGDLIPYLNEGLIGMAPGGKRRLVVPPDQAYGAAGRPPIIPPNATLIVELELVGWQEALPPMAMPDLKKLKLKSNPSGLKWFDSVVGAGAEVKAGDDVLVNYAGYLEDGTEFDSSVRAGRPLPVAGVGKSGVVAGWNEGLQGMRSGGRRVLVVPPSLAWGDKGFPGAVPPNTTTVFVIDALQVRAH